MGKHESSTLLPEPGQATERPKRTTTQHIWFILRCYAIYILVVHGIPHFLGSMMDGPSDDAAVCPQVDVLVPSSDLWANLSTLYAGDAFKATAIERLGGAVRVPTETFDNMGLVGEDPRWESRGPFVDWLLTAFPNV